MTVNEINAKLDAVDAPLFVKQGPRAIKWFKVYEFDHPNTRSGYSIAKRQAFNILFGYGLHHLAS